MNAIYLGLTVLLWLPGPGQVADSASAAPPDWVKREGWFEPPVRFRVVASELWATPDQALEDALGRAAAVARDYAAQADSEIADDWEPPTRLVHDQLVSSDYLEKVAWDYGPMYRAHLLLELSPENRKLLLTDWERVHTEWEQDRTSRRLSQIGAGLAFMLVCLGTLLGYLRLDEATRGYYTPWLMTGAGAVVVGTAVVLYTIFTA